MIVDTMDIGEVIENLKKDVNENVLPKVRGGFGVDVEKKHIRELYKIGGWRNKCVKFKPIPIQTKNGNTILWRVVCYNGYFMSLFVSEVIHRKRMYVFCMGNENKATLYTKHCIERYGERVIGMDMDGVNIMNFFIDKMCLPSSKSGVEAFVSCFPSPHHKKSIYYGTDKALFLGDDYGNLDCVLRTCISREMCHHTECKIFDTIAFVIETESKYPEMEADEKDLFMDCIHKCMLNREYKDTYIRYISSKYLICKLEADYNTHPYSEENTMNTMRMYEKRLRFFGINSSSISPYGEKNGIARKGELDYIG